MLFANLPKRNFTATNIKTVCMLANSRQADLIGSKIIRSLRAVSGDSISFHGYGGDWMKQEGFEPTVEIDIDMMQDKQFHTYRKTKTANENIHFRWNPMNLVNKGYKRMTDDAYRNVSVTSISFDTTLFLYSWRALIWPRKSTRAALISSSTSTTST